MLDDGNKSGVAANIQHRPIVDIESTLHMEKTNDDNDGEKRENLQQQNMFVQLILCCFLFELSFLVYPFNIILFFLYHSMVDGESILWLDYCYSKMKKNKAQCSMKTTCSMPLLIETLHIHHNPMHVLKAKKPV